MPATEKTWRDQARMHVIFGISALVMLGGTIWMLAKDHRREWREWQLEDRARERWTLEAQLHQAEVDSKDQLEQLRVALAAERSSKIDVALVDRFKQIVQQREKQPNFSKLDSVLVELNEAENGSDAATKARNGLL